MTGAPIGGTPPGTALDQFVRDSYQLIQAVHAELPAIRAIAEHLTPVEDLVEFQNEVEALHAQLGLLVAASEIIVQITDFGFDLISADDAPAARAVLGLGSAALRDESYFTTKVEFDILHAQVQAIAADVANVWVVLATKVSHDELAAALAPILARLGTAETTLADLGLGVEVINQSLQNGVYWDEWRQRTITLETRIDDPTTGLSGLSTAQQQLTSRVTQTELGITALAQDAVNLTTQVSDLEQGLAAESTARQVLTTRTEILEGLASSQSAALTDLSAQVTDVHNQIDLQGNALNELTVRVQATEAGQLLAASERSALDLRLTDAETGITAHGAAIDTMSLQIEQNADELTIAGERVTQLEASIVGGGNMLANAGLEFDLRGWTFFSRGSGWLDGELGRDFNQTYLPPGMYAILVTDPGVPAGDAGIRSDRIPVEPGKNHILSGWLASENCTVRLEYRLFDGAGDEIGFGVVGEVVNTPPVPTITGWPRVHGVVPVSNDAVQMEVQLWVTDCNTNPPKAWLMRPMVEQAIGLQTNPSPWTPSNVGLEEVVAGALQDLTVRVTQTEDTLESVSTSTTDLVSRVGQIAEWRVVSHMTSGTYDSVGSPLPATLRRAGAEVPAHTFERGLTLVRFAVNGELASATRYDTFSNATERDNLRDALNALGPTDYFVLVAQDHHGIKQQDLTEALENCGALTFNEVIGSRPYVLLGRGDLGKGGGIEVYPLSEDQWVDHTFTLVNDRIKGLSLQPGLPVFMAANATAIFDLSTRVTATEDDITALSTAQLSLGARLETAEGALVNEMITRANGDAAEATARNTLAAQMRGAYTGTDIDLVTTGLIYSERQARVTADSAMASDITALDARLDTAEGNISSQASAINSLTTRITTAEGDIDTLSSDLTSLTATVGTKASTAALNALTTRVTTAEGNITANSNSITSLQANLGGSANLLVNSTFDNGLEGISGPANAYFKAVGINVQGGTTYRPPNVNTIGRQPTTGGAVVSVDNYCDTHLAYIDGIEPGSNYCISGYVGLHRSRSIIFIQWLDAGGGNLGYTVSSTVVGSPLFPGEDATLADFQRMFKFGIAPAGAVRAKCVWRLFGNDQADPYGWLARPMFEKASPMQVNPSQWSESATGTGINASAIQSLDTRVTTAEGSIVANASAITSLTATVNTKANASAVTALDARVTSVEGVTTSQASSITQLQATLGGGGNLLPNSDFALGYDAWVVTKSGSATGTATKYPGTANLSYYIPERGGVFIRNTGGNALPNGTYVDLDSNGYDIPVTAGKRYIGSAYLGAHRCDGILYIRWLDASKAHISYANGQVLAAANGGTAISQYDRAVVYGTAPANAAYCRIKIRAIGNAETGIDSYLFINSPMLEESATATQTSPSPYSVGMSGSATITQLAMTTADSALGKANATVGVTLDVNKNITGYRITNDGTTGIFSIVADKFQIVSPGGGARTEFSNGNWRVYDASGVMRVRMGIW